MMATIAAWPVDPELRVGHGMIGCSGGHAGARDYCFGSPSSRGPGRGPFKAKTRVRIPLGTIPSASFIVRDFDQRKALESRPVVFRLDSVGAAVKNTLIVNAANVYGLGSSGVCCEPCAAWRHRSADAPSPALLVCHTWQRPNGKRRIMSTRRGSCAAILSRLR